MLTYWVWGEENHIYLQAHLHLIGDFGACDQAPSLWDRRAASHTAGTRPEAGHPWGWKAQRRDSKPCWRCYWTSPKHNLEWLDLSKHQTAFSLLLGFALLLLLEPRAVLWQWVARFNHQPSVEKWLLWPVLISLLSILLGCIVSQNKLRLLDWFLCCSFCLQLLLTTPQQWAPDIFNLLLFSASLSLPFLFWQRVSGAEQFHI